MIHYIASNNGQTLLHTSRNAQEQGIHFAVLNGRPAALVRASLNATIARCSTPQVFPEFISEEWIAERNAQNAKEVEAANATLAKIAHLEDSEIAWESASWHADSVLADKAARKSKAFKTLIVSVESKNL
jgi:hypothetical protein